MAITAAFVSLTIQAGVPAMEGQVTFSSVPFVREFTSIEEEAYNEAIKLAGTDDALGDMGRLYIPASGVSVPLYGETGDNGLNQGIVDRDNSALVLTTLFEGQQVIADHNYQGFEGIKSSVPGNTLAYIKTQGEVRAYICTDIFCGHNDDVTLYDGNYICIKDYNPDGITMYTCNDHWTNITITFWMPVDMQHGTLYDPEGYGQEYLPLPMP